MKRIGLFIIAFSLVLSLFSCAPSEDFYDGEKPEERVTFKAQYVRTDGYHETEKYPQVKIIESKSELDDYYEEYKDYYQFDYAEKLSFNEARVRYDDTYFQDRILLMVLVEEPSGSNRHQVEEILLEDGKMTVEIDRLIPEWGEDDMALWHLLIEPEAGVKITDEEAVTVLLERKNMAESLWD